MAKKNRRRDVCHLKVKMGVGIILFGIFVLAPWVICSILNLSANQVANEIKRLEQTQRNQDAALVRVSSEWNQMIEPHRLSEAIARKGLVMQVAKPDRQIRVNERNAFVMNEKLRRDLIASRSMKENGKTASKR
jgi:hypothetical protein